VFNLGVNSSLGFVLRINLEECQEVAIKKHHYFIILTIWVLIIANLVRAIGWHRIYRIPFFKFSNEPIVNLHDGTIRRGLSLFSD
jgi:hypothetical protein